MTDLTGPRVFINDDSVPVEPETFTTSQRPLPPQKGNGDSIFISIASYRDGERCGETLQSIFENAAHPDKVTIGLVEQNNANDVFCVEQYCKLVGDGKNLVKRRTIRKGVTKVVRVEGAKLDCPHANQIHVVAFHDLAAKGPLFARSLTRKVLGNQDYCLQIDAHTAFVDDWDAKVVMEWKATSNEFAVISTLPFPKTVLTDFSEGGDKATHVPRQCTATFRDNGFPDFAQYKDVIAADLEKPLLSHAWSAAFSFSKCHLEESVPADPFAPYAMPIEQYSKYARMWTRGYDTYTPTQNIVFHDNGVQANGHGKNEWFKHQRNRFRQLSIERVKNLLELSDAPDKSPTTLANFGIYGLGKRRTLQQLAEYSHLSWDPKQGNTGKPIKNCVGHQWVPYDVSISPVDNLYDKPDNLDPQPEYPLRTNLQYYQQVDQPMPLPNLNLDGAGAGVVQQNHEEGPDAMDVAAQQANSGLPSLPMVVLLWIFGLIVWCSMFLNNGAASNVVGAAMPKTKKKKKKTIYKDV